MRTGKQREDEEPGARREGFALDAFPSTEQTGHGSNYTCNASTQEAEAADSELEEHPWLQSDFKASLGYITRSEEK